MFDCSQIVIDKNSPEPLHIQLQEELRRLIRELNPEEYGALPSERTLCARLELHRKTVHTAYEELLHAGIVRRQPNKSLTLTPAARKKLEGSLSAIGVVLPMRFSQYIQGRAHAQKMLEGIFDRCAERDYAVYLLELPPPVTPEKERRKFITDRFSRLSGVLLLGDRQYAKDPMLDDLFHYCGIPQMALLGEVNQQHIGAVKCRFDKAAADMACFFRDRGVRTVGTIDFDIHNFRRSGYEYASRTRAKEMQQYFLNAELALPEKWQLHELPAENQLHGELPDAFWCRNDICALQLLELLKKYGLERKSIVGGFDGLLTDPDLATIRQPYWAMGARAVDLLLEHYEFGITPENRIQYLDAEFIPSLNHKERNYHEERKEIPVELHFD